MDAMTILIVFLCLCVAWHVVATLLIYSNLRRRDQRVSFIWLRLMSPWYASQYKKITRKETGRVGPLFYHWIVSINLALVLALVAVVVRYS